MRCVLFGLALCLACGPALVLAEKISVSVYLAPAVEGDPSAPPKPIAPADGAKSPDAADLEAMQGLWVYHAANAAGVKIRIEKSIDGNSDTVTHFDANGNTIHAHASTSS